MAGTNENLPVTTNPVDIELVHRILKVFEVLALEVNRDIDPDDGDSVPELVDGCVSICGQVVRGEVPPEVALFYQRNALVQGALQLPWFVPRILYASGRVMHAPALVSVLGTYVMGACAGKDATDEVILLGQPWSQFAFLQLSWPPPTTTLEEIAHAARARCVKASR
jgi:hypothetical protein